MADQVTRADDQSDRRGNRQAGADKDGHKDDGRENKDDRQKQKRQKQPARWPWYVGGLIILGFVGIVLYMEFIPDPDVWTDDAYTMVHYATIAPRVSGQITTVPVHDNQFVRAGQVLVTLDPRDFQARVAEAKAALERDTARLADASASFQRQPDLISQQQAEVEAAQARLLFSQQNARRYTNLAATGAGTEQQRQQYTATLRQDQASLNAARASLQASQRTLDVLKSQVSASEGVMKSDQAQLHQADLNLSYTMIYAPMDGQVGEKSVQIGNYVTPGAAMMSVVPLEDIYIVANYREEDVRHVRSGQDVTIHIDAYNIYLHGKVDSVPPATGAAFSPIPPNNATGNFTKIVQRLPVKIDVDPGQPLARLLRIGLSCETTIHTHLEDVVQEQGQTPNRITVH